MPIIMQAIHDGILPLIVFVFLARPVATWISQTWPSLQNWSLWAAVAAFAAYSVAIVAYRGCLDAWFLVLVFLIALLVATVVGQLATVIGGILLVLVVKPLEPLREWIQQRIRSQRSRQFAKQRATEETRRNRLRLLREEFHLQAEEQRQKEAERLAIAQEEAALRSKAIQVSIDDHRDRLRYDLRFSFQFLDLEPQQLLSYRVFNGLLEHALLPSDIQEIDRRSEKLSILIESLQSPPDSGLGGIEKIAITYQERRKKVSELDLPEQTKDKIIRWLRREEVQQIFQHTTEDPL